ncbi:nuclear transport factor 2 family protein [Xanthomonas hyacinthi]|uniref:SnoaL-like domain-containing protein n=1 Tax=Xanthomonas hyacinthi TaxID=56455 RepID=A0A2S7EQD0_9XANT|nr:hypothetical protein XhyaCFBP1156_19255 [Xanthomonas hyacinthi]
MYRFGGESIDEAQVRDLYLREQRALETLDHEALCAMFSEDFTQSMLVRRESEQKHVTMDKAQVCAASEDATRVLSQLASAGRRSELYQYSYTILSVEIAPDQRSALVEARSTLATPFLRTTTRTHDTIVRRRWRTYASASEGTTWVGPVYR